MAVARVKDTQAVVSIYVHELMSSTVLSPGTAFNVDHPVVAQAPWAFVIEDDDGTVEDASAEPGKKRRTRRPKADDTTTDD